MRALERKSHSADLQRSCGPSEGGTRKPLGPIYQSGKLPHWEGSVPLPAFSSIKSIKTLVTQKVQFPSQIITSGNWRDQGSKSLLSRCGTELLSHLHLVTHDQGAPHSVAERPHPAPRQPRTCLGQVLTAAPSPPWRTHAFVLVDSFYTGPPILTRLAGAFADV